MSTSVKNSLLQTDGAIRLLEAHDRFSAEVTRNVMGEQGQVFQGLWISGLTQTTYLGVPDTETISPLQRAKMQEVSYKAQIKDERLMCAAFDADSGGSLADIPELVDTLTASGISMAIIEDKVLEEPGKKVNSLLKADGSQLQADPHEFTKVIRAFQKSATGKELLVTARIESLNVRIPKEDRSEEAFSVQEAIQDALDRAFIYRSAGADAIMIHSKSRNPSEVLEFIRRFRKQDPATPLVVVPTTYCTTSRDTLVEAGANVIIYANHLMRAKIKAVETITQALLSKNPDLFAGDQIAKACLSAQNYGSLLRSLLDKVGGENSENDAAKDYLVAAQKSAIKNMAAVANKLALGDQSGCEADDLIIPVKELLKINAVQVTKT